VRNPQVETQAWAVAESMLWKIEARDLTQNLAGIGQWITEGTVPAAYR
jgi:hypothetical protein